MCVSKFITQTSCLLSAESFHLKNGNAYVVDKVGRKKVRRSDKSELHWVLNKRLIELKSFDPVIHLGGQWGSNDR